MRGGYGGGIIEYLEVVCWWGWRKGGGYVVMVYHSFVHALISKLLRVGYDLKGTEMCACV